MQREHDYANNAVKKGLTRILFLDSKRKMKLITREIKVYIDAVISSNFLALFFWLKKWVCSKCGHCSCTT